MHLVPGCTWSWQVYLVPGGVPDGPGGVPGSGGVPAGPGGGPVDRMTDMCKNITFANFICRQ